MNQIEYKPWAANNVKEIINRSSQELPILDIQLGGTCNINSLPCI